MGKLSDLFTLAGADPAAALTDAIAWGQGMFLLTGVLLYLAMRHLPKDEANRLERARALGEEVMTAKRG
jgi:hypothetical protein